LVSSKAYVCHQAHSRYDTGANRHLLPRIPPWHLASVDFFILRESFAG
jgi:hypothetical protein